MDKDHSTSIAVGATVLIALLASAPAALAGPAVDQYSEGIPTAGGHKSSQDAVRGASQGGGGGTSSHGVGGASYGGGAASAISPGTRSKLDKSAKGTAAAKLAQITAPSRSSSGASDSGPGGMGLLLPVILVGTLLAALAVFLARRRLGETSA
jgi:hypothetical protein